MKRSREPFVTWRKILKPGEIAEMAREAGFGERNRKLIPRRLFWGMTLGFGVEPKRTLAGLTRFTCTISGIRLTRQGFHQRLTREAADFFRRCLARLCHRAGQWIRAPLPGKLAAYEDCVLLDSTTMKLAKRLAARFPGCRTNVRLAAAKIHARMSLTQQQVERLAITGERVPDRKGLRIAQGVRGRLLAFDLAYLDYALFGEIVAAEGAFVCRLKTTCNGRIVRVRRGCAKRHVGEALNQKIYAGRVVDLDIEFGRGKTAVTARVIGLWNPESTDYHWYVTSLDPDGFSPDEIAQIYGLRWQIELLFAEWKTVLRVAQLPSGKEEIVQCLISAALCAAVLSRLVLWMTTTQHRLPWYEMSTVVATIILGHYAAALGSAALRGRRDRLKPILETVLEATAVHAWQPRNANAIAAFGEEAV